MGPAELRTHLIKRLKHYGIATNVLDAMEKVPRELFIPEQQKPYAYQDTPLSIEMGQTISAPHMVAIMCNLLEIEEGMTILEVGTGSGYHAAVMAELTREKGHVYTIECYERLAQNAKEKLKRTVYTNITVITGDGSEGLKEHAPYDRISVAAAAPEIPQPLIDQLKRGGRMVIPIGTRHHQELYLVTKNHKTRIERKGGVAFVPLTGKYGIESKHEL